MERLEDEPFREDGGGAQSDTVQRRDAEIMHLGSEAKKLTIRL